MNSMSEKNQTVSSEWAKDNIRQLRLRMGWSRSDIARRLQCSTEDVIHFEEGTKDIELCMKSELEILLRRAEAYGDEVRMVPTAENKCDQDALQQIDFSKIKAELD